MKKIFIIISFLSFLFSHYSISHSYSIYKEIKIYNNNLNNHQTLNSLGIDVDHIYRADDYIQFVINEHDLNKLVSANIEFDIIHQDIEEFYKSRRNPKLFSRDFNYGSMGGYYNFEELNKI